MIIDYEKFCIGLGDERFPECVHKRIMEILDACEIIKNEADREALFTELNKLEDELAKEEEIK